MERRANCRVTAGTRRGDGADDSGQTGDRAERLADRESDALRGDSGRVDSIGEPPHDSEDDRIFGQLVPKELSDIPRPRCITLARGLLHF